VSPTPSMRAHWGCHGTEAMAIQFINCTDEIRVCLNAPEVLHCTYISRLFINQFLSNFIFFYVIVCLVNFRKMNRSLERFASC
jgi:hypothetical protein